MNICSPRSSRPLRYHQLSFRMKMESADLKVLTIAPTYGVDDSNETLHIALFGTHLEAALDILLGFLFAFEQNFLFPSSEGYFRENKPRSVKSYSSYYSLFHSPVDFIAMECFQGLTSPQGLTSALQINMHSLYHDFNHHASSLLEFLCTFVWQLFSSASVEANAPTGTPLRHENCNKVVFLVSRNDSLW